MLREGRERWLVEVVKGGGGRWLGSTVAGAGQGRFGGGLVVVWWVGFLMGGVMRQNKNRNRGCTVRCAVRRGLPVASRLLGWHRGVGRAGAVRAGWGLVDARAEHGGRRFFPLPGGRRDTGETGYSGGPAGAVG